MQVLIVYFLILLTAPYSGCYDKKVNENMKDIEYAKVGGVSLTLDYYTPGIEKAGNPAIIWFAGGGGSHKNRAAEEAVLLSEAGYAVFAPDYGIIADQQPYPSYIHNIKGVIRYVRSHATEYGINPDNIFVGGTSFGGIAASIAALTANRPDLEGDVGGNLNVSSTVSGAIDFFGSVYFGRVEGSNTPIEKTEKAFMVIFGCPDVNTCPQADSLMVERFINSSSAPFLIVHGLDDKLSSPIQSELLHQKLEDAGVTSELILVDGMKHDDELVSMKLDDVLDFMEKNTK